ncbi:MAG: hypothetical protein AAB225_07945 [Acidobacteriota bacterium]
MIAIRPVETWQDRREFLGFPYRLNRGDPYWAPPLRIQQKRLFDTRRHPFYAHAEMRRFLARRSRIVLGAAGGQSDSAIAQQLGGVNK